MNIISQELQMHKLEKRYHLVWYNFIRFIYISYLISLP